jgi:hypothetical protein
VIFDNLWEADAFPTITRSCEAFLILITAGTGVIEGALKIASESLEGFMRS